MTRDAVRDAPVNILIVDDESANLTALEAVLEEPGYRLVRATSGEEALRALVAHEFACLLLDVQMPGMNGFELARRIEARTRGGRAPIIFLTAHCQEEEDALEGYASGGVDYLHKPFHPAVLRRKVQVFADLHRTQRELQVRAEERDARLDLAAEEAEGRKDKFLATLAHELRNPLAPISNAVQIIRGKAAAELTVQWACDIVGRQIGVMTRLIDDLLPRLPAVGAAGEGLAAGAGAAPLRVLVVDDEKSSAETLAALLEIKGFEVRLAHDGVAALEAAEAFLPEVVLLDIGLPRLDGFAVAQRLRDRPHLRDALLIALTGYGDADTRARAARAGFDSHMTKPADVERLLPMLADPQAARRGPAKLVERRLPPEDGAG
jgi:CheY-like chemotaxis protein